MYDELVKALRYCNTGGDGCVDCSYADTTGCIGVIREKAADAIEELQAQNNELLFRCVQAEALIDYYQTGKLLSNEPPKEEAK